MKKKCPKTDPCGTQYFNSLLPDCDLSMLVNYIILLENEQNQFLAIPLIP